MDTATKKIKQLTNDINRCPVRDVLNHVADKWSITIIHILGEYETLRFNEISYIVNGISQKMLTVTLKKLLQDGIITRKQYPVMPPKVEYSLTELGKNLLPILSQLVEWATVNLPKIKENQEKYNKK
ncbi:helix-turn-helix domain-containing protein [Flavobacterium sp. Fl-77]|uniref:Helix-turn-helix domain-containing protein n=1 Tax=Flavobacterium flavipigmentatum TaxID=2893884 RepID=A0AAJ2S6W6_9FLAO|nr:MULTISPECIES: helix-turn-helix domain-containing protein [unclassified Flavobacterium]MDX6182429.1 helix-turn-helix domain-containing protein [Flavobacterium sp. Fl-33]MDX6185658.1 helix-turn-helix domain-containing protein [Flavobacterium sp. Fl-77]UFH38843.1 helix-turn-helix transcriptional regulator [Flavobacterium sp. F-70]